MPFLLVKTTLVAHRLQMVATREACLKHLCFSLVSGVLVVSPCFDTGYKRKDVDMLWRIAARTDSRIEPIPAGTRQFEEDDSSTIIEIARRYGQKISPSA